jgi:hypothetical protein
LAAGFFVLGLTALVFRTAFLSGRFVFVFGLRAAARFVFFTLDFRFFVFLAMTIPPASLGRFGHKPRSLRSDLR